MVEECRVGCKSLQAFHLNFRRFRGLCWRWNMGDKCFIILLATLACATPLRSVSGGGSGPYKPTWNSIDSRPLPSWYDEAKFGLFVHWGVYSVPGYASEWFWWYWQGTAPRPDVRRFMRDNYPPGFTYPDFAHDFRAQFFDAAHWARVFQASGAKYVVVTTKHHEGFTMYPSKYSWNWNSVDTGPHRDLVGELMSAVRNNTDLKFGTYFSLFEWFNPLYLSDKASNFSISEYVDEVSWPQLHEIVERYRPDVLWADGPSGPHTYWRSLDFLAWLYNQSPVKDKVVTNDRWGDDGIMCHHGGYYTCADQFQPNKVMNHKWENCLKIETKSWGFRRNANIEDFLTIEDILGHLIKTVCFGGNLLLNVGPTSDGTLAPIFQERLQQLGTWLAHNGEAIYGTRPWRCQNDTLADHVWYTSKPGGVYALMTRWPAGNALTLEAPRFTSAPTRVSLLGLGPGGGALSWKRLGAKGGLRIDLSDVALKSGVKVLGRGAWGLKLQNVK